MLTAGSYNRAMTGSEISRELGITRQAVSQSLKRAVKKVYHNLLETRVAENPVDAMLTMREWFDIRDDEDIRQFYELFPKHIQEEVRTYARTHPIE